MVTRYLRFFLLCAGLVSAGCTPPAQATPGTPPALYVASAVERTLVPLEATSGRPGGTPLRLEVAPEQVAPGPDGGLLLLSTTGGDGILTFLSSATLRASAGTHRGRAITLGRLPLSAIPRLASDGVRFAAVLSVTAEPGALRDCRL